LTVGTVAYILRRFPRSSGGWDLVVKPLLINVDNLEEANQPWQAEVPVESVDDILSGDHPSEFKGAGPLTVRAKLTRMGRKVLVQAKFEVRLVGSCKRCLAPVQVPAPIDMTLTFIPDPGGHRHRPSEVEAEKSSDRSDRADRDEEGSCGSFDPALADEEPYSGSSFDLAPAVREQILLALPTAPLCREECKGLCQTCGLDLNQRECGHEPDNTDPRWAALKKIQLTDSPGSQRKKE
jgi:uncharacterized protein